MILTDLQNIVALVLMLLITLWWWLDCKLRKLEKEKVEFLNREMNHDLREMAKRQRELDRQIESTLTKISERDYAIYGVPKEEIIDLVRAEDWTPKSFIKLRKEIIP